MKKQLIPIFAVVLVDMMSFAIIIPLLPFYAQRFGASALQIGLLASSFSVCQFLSAPWLGALSDRYGRKPVLMISQLGTALGLMLLASANSLSMILLARILDGFTAGNIAVAQAYAADVTKPEERSGAFSVLNIGFGAGVFLGPVIAALFGRQSQSGPIWVAAGISLANLIGTLIFLPRVAPKQKACTSRAQIAPWRFFRRADIRVRLVQFFFFVFAFSYFIEGVGLFVYKKMQTTGGTFDAVDLAYVYSYAGLWSVIIQLFIVGRLVKRFGEPSLIAISFLISGVTFAGLAWMNSPLYLYVAASIWPLGNANLRACLSGSVSKMAGGEEQGELLGLLATITSFGQILAPVVGGWLIDREFLFAWPVGLGSLFIAGYVLTKVKRQRGAAEQLREAS